MRESRLTAELKTGLLPDNTRRLFGRLHGDPALAGFTLIGGSALTLQIGHRISEDLEFNVFGGQLPAGRIDQLLNALEREGVPVASLGTDAAKSQFRINFGASMDAYIQDYAIGDTKVTFQARSAPPYSQAQIDFLRNCPRALPGPSTGFDILGLKGLFAMKSLVLADRAKSRDIFDLMVLTRDHGYTLGDLLDVVKQYAPRQKQDVERYKSVLVGAIALDQNDEGFESIKVDEKIADIHRYFQQMIDRYETGLAQAFSESIPPAGSQS